MRAWMAVVALILLAWPLTAQLNELLEVQVMELDVTALDSDGHPVEGLTRHDFDVQIGGRVVAISNFFAVSRGVVVNDEQSGSGRPAPRSACRAGDREQHPPPRCSSSSMSFI